MQKNQAREIIEGLVARFNDNIDSYKSTSYNEAQTRLDFINPFFRALGWDVDNQNGNAEAYREVIYEDKIKIGGATKAPDYSFRLPGGKRLFFVEAKKPSVSVKDDMQPAYQVRRYGWSAKLPVSIITDFEEFAVYDCTKKPYSSDKASVARINYLTYQNYLTEFDFLWDTFSKERVLQGRFDKFVLSDTHKKGTTTVDREFLTSLDDWRTQLAVNISKNNPQLDEDELNFVVQQTIDRIIFLRIAEDRGIEQYGMLKESLGKGDYYKNLYTLFLQADDKYNSGLFDMKKDKLSKSLVVENKTLKKILNELYYPESPYEFSVLSVEILGSAYEQFLGKVIRIDKHGKAKIEEKPEVRKAGGVYYTPQYIVDYIVKNTVGKLIEGKTPKEIEKIKIADPACGSGSFLLGAYQYLLDYHKNYYSDSGTKGGKKGSPLTPDGSLTSTEKKRILLNNIYGVDIDTNAVEVTKLSLLLKCMEGETSASISEQLALFHERVLPTLDSNIKSGNSLIDTDFYESKLDFGEDRKIKPFSWQKAFPEVFKQGGFDAVIGNPPYGAEISKEEQVYALKKYNIGSTDTAALFLIQAKNLIKNSAYFGFIIPKAFTYASNWAQTRSRLLNDIISLVDCSKVWNEVKLEMSIVIYMKSSNLPQFESYVRHGVDIHLLTSILKKLCIQFDFILNGVTAEEVSIGLKLKKLDLNLNNLVTNRRGGMLQKHLKDSGPFSVLGGKQIQRYFVEESDKYIESHHDQLNSVIHANGILVQNLVAHIQNPKPHIKIIATIPDSKIIKQCLIQDTVNQLVNNSDLSSYLILGLLNSKLINWYSYRFIFANAVRTMHFDSVTTDKIPIPLFDLKNRTINKFYNEIINNVESLIHLNKEKRSTKLQSKVEQIQTRIDFHEDKINQAVYQLYGLTEDEIKIVEDSVNS